MPHTVPTKPSAYLLAVAAVLVGLAIRLAVEFAAPLDRNVFVFFSAAVAVAAWWGGLRPGLLATVLSLLLVNYFFVPPRYGFKLTTLNDTASVIFFALQGIFLSWLGGSNLAALRRAQLAREDLERRVQERTADLKQTNTALTDQIEENDRVYAELQEQADQLERSNRELQDFASVASHDLQEPLRKIQAFGDRLRTTAADSLSDTAKDYLDRMQNAASRMQVLINDLLTFSRVTTQAQPFQQVDLSAIARDVLIDLEARIEQLGGRVELSELPAIEADPLQMRQLLQNLIGNGLKFHQSDLPPVVRVRGAVTVTSSGSPDGQTLPICRLEIEDNGIGFDEKYLDRIFNIFQRLHGRTAYEGTGIGLAVCRKIVERHGGTITARSQPDAGATFTIELPLRQEAPGGVYQSVA